MTTPDDSSPNDGGALDRMLREAKREHRIAQERVAEFRQATLQSPKDVTLLSNLAGADAEERRWVEIVRELSDQQEECEQQRATQENQPSASAFAFDATQAGEQYRQRWLDEFPIHPRDEDYVRDSLAYWRSLTGYGRAFEKAVGELFRDLCFDVLVTQYSGDGGVDIHLEKGGETTLIQCKAERYRVSRGVLKAILEVGEAKLADHVGCATTTGFSEKAEKFAEGWVIDLYGPETLAELGARAKQNPCDGIGNLVIEPMNAPSCPDCGKVMLQRLPHHSVQPFWGCSDYPRCTGLRSLD